MAEKTRPTHSILLVDDDPSVCSMLLDYFEGRYEVTAAGNANEALELCGKRAFDMVISDINMPG